MGTVNHFQVVQYTGIIFLQAYKFLYQRTDVKLSSDVQAFVHL